MPEFVIPGEDDYSVFPQYFCQLCRQPLDDDLKHKPSNCPVYTGKTIMTTPSRKAIDHEGGRLFATRRGLSNRWEGSFIKGGFVDHYLTLCEASDADEALEFFKKHKEELDRD